MPWPSRQFKWRGAPACYHASLVCLRLPAPDLPLTELSFLFPSVSSLSTQQCFLPQSPLMFKDQMQQDVIMVLKFPSNSPVTHVAANTLPHLTIPAVVTVTCSRLFAVNRWHNTVGTWVSALAGQRRRRCWGAHVSLPREPQPEIVTAKQQHSLPFYKCSSIVNKNIKPSPLLPLVFLANIL